MLDGIDFNLPTMPAVLIVLVSAVILLVSQDWRWSIGALMLQYLGAFILVDISWPLQMSLVKLIAGWFSAFVLGLASIGVFGNRLEGNNHTNRPGSTATIPPSTNISGFLFHILATIVIALAVVSVIPEFLQRLEGVTMEQVLGSLILISLGLLHLGFTAHPLRIILGLLTVLAGFEVIYAAVELSTMVAGLLSGVNLGLAVLGAYLISAPTMERVE